MTRLIAPAPTDISRSGAAPTFTVIVGAFNAAETLAEAVESALAQTFSAHEVIVCDDGSTDDTLAVLQQFGDRIRVLRQEHRGPGAAKRTASEAASGDFVVILDADDAFHPRRLEALAEAAASRPDLDLLTTDAVYELDGVVVHRRYGSADDFVTAHQRRAILQQNFIFGGAAVRRAKLLDAGGFDASLPRLDDWDCWIRLLLAGSAVGLVHEALYRYRIHRGSLSFDGAADLREQIHMLERTRTNPYLLAEERPLLERAIAAATGSALALDAREAVRDHRPGRRRLLASLATAPGVPGHMRIKAIAALAAPGLAARHLRRRSPTDYYWLINRGNRRRGW